METYNRFAFYFGIVMSLLYVIGGLYIMLDDRNIFSLTAPYKIILGLLMIGYGVFRFSRYRKNKLDQNNEPEHDE